MADMADREAKQEEFLELRRLEGLLRDFERQYQQHVANAIERGSVHHPFAPPTVELMEAAQPILSQLDELRKLRPVA